MEILKKLVPWLFICFFILASPFLIIFATGYKYNSKNGAWEKTSSLAIDSIPSGAKIKLNGKLVKETTPAHISRLLPGIYEVSVSKPGYSTWKKTLETAASSVVFANSIRLFASDVPKIQAASGIHAITAAHNRIYILRINTSGGWILESRTEPDAIAESEIPVLGLADDLGDMKLTAHEADPSVFLIAEKNSSRNWVLKIEDDQVLAIPITADLRDVTLYPKDFLLFGKDRKGHLVSLNPIEQKKPSSPILKQSIVQFTPARRVLRPHIYYSTRETNGQHMLLGKVNLDAKDKPETLITLPSTASGEVLIGPKNLLTIIDPQNRLVLFVDIQRGAVVGETPGVHILWHEKNPMALVWDIKTLFLVYRNSSGTLESILLGHFEEPITDALWIEEEKTTSILLAQEKILRAIEIDERDKRNIVTLLETDSPIKKIIKANSQGAALLVDDKLIFRQFLKEDN